MSDTDYTTHHYYELARRAHSGTSFSPERRAAQAIAELEATLQRLRDLGASDEDITRVEAKWSAHMSTLTGIYSTLIAGAAKFPAAKMEKKNATAAKREAEYHELVGRIMRRLRVLRNPSPNDPIDLDSDDAIQRIDERIANEEQRLAAAKEQRATQTAQNIRNRIKTLKAQRAKAEALQTMKKSAAQPIAFDGGEIFVEEARVQISFDSRPDEELKASLQARGFKWSPTRQTWVRAYSEAALHWAKQITKAEII